jgi:hypothetical protein
MARGRSSALLAVALVAGSSACSLLYSVDGLSVDSDAAAPAPSACDAGCSDAVSAPDVQVVQLPGGGSCACVDAPPPDWQGPAALASGAGTAPSCAGSYTVDVLQAFADPDAPAAQCGCTCKAGSATCPSTFPINIYGSSTCGGTKCDTVTLSVGACVNVQANCTFANGVGPAPAPQGDCTAQPTATVPKAGWKRATRACLLPAPPRPEACGAGALCVPLPGAPLEPRPCIFRTGDVACPGGVYSVKRVVYGDAKDDRACSTCTCGDLTGSCPAMIRKECASSTPLNVTTCGSIGDPTNIMLVSAPQPTGASCPPTGGTPTGSMTPTSPTTFCCVP